MIFIYLLKCEVGWWVGALFSDHLVREANTFYQLVWEKNSFFKNRGEGQVLFLKKIIAGKSKHISCSDVLDHNGASMSKIFIFILACGQGLLHFSQRKTHGGWLIKLEILWGLKNGGGGIYLHCIVKKIPVGLRVYLYNVNEGCLGSLKVLWKLKDIQRQPHQNCSCEIGV